MKSRGGERGNRSLLGLWPGGECSHSGALQGGRSHCWPVLGGAAQLFLPPQPAGRAPVTRLCCPLSSQAWLDSWQTGPCSALALEGGRQQSLLSHKEEGQVKNKTKKGKGQVSWCLACLSDAARSHHSQLYSESEGMQLGRKNRERHLLV